MLRLRPTFKGTLTALLAFLALLLGSALDHPYLNLSGYALLGVLLVGTAMGVLAIRGVRVKAVASRRHSESTETDVWVSLDSRSAAGPFGLDVEGYLGSEIPVHAPDRVGKSFTLAAPPERLCAELRSLPMGLVEITRRVPVVWLAPGSTATERMSQSSATTLAEPDGRVRDHRPGEGMRQVHWPLTARLQRLIVRVRELGSEDKPRPQPMREVEEPPSLPDVHLEILRALTVLATLGAIAFLWQQAALSTSVVALLFPLVLLGGLVSLRRAGPPSKALLLVLYVGILALLAWFVSDFRVNVMSRGPIALTVMSVAALFAWDLRDRSYIRAQLFLVVFASVLLPAFFEPKDGQGAGLAFGGVMGALLLAAWAEGRHAIGATRVRLSELGSLRAAIVPFAFLAAMVLILHPWLPAIPLPSLPSFGFSQVRTAESDAAAQVPGQGGRVNLDARWPMENRPAVEVQGGSERLRTEVFDTYRAGEWVSTPRTPADWPQARAEGDWIRLTLKAGDMQVLPLPPGTAGLREALLEPVRHADGVVQLSRPAWSGYSFEALVVGPSQKNDELPMPAERQVMSEGPAFGVLARQLAGDAATPQDAMERLAHHLRKAYRYDLQSPQAPSGDDPVWHFLTESHRGFCVHFASALALLGRELEVPTRFVVGYSSGRQVGGVTIFEERHAHAWVEAYLDGRWITFDPTPGGGLALPMTFEQGRLGLALGLLLVVGGLLWKRQREPEPVRRYRAALRRLSKLGAPITDATSPAEALALASSYLKASQWEEFQEDVRAYEKMRFSRPDA